MLVNIEYVFSDSIFRQTTTLTMYDGQPNKNTNSSDNWTNVLKPRVKCILTEQDPGGVGAHA